MKRTVLRGIGVLLVAGCLGALAVWASDDTGWRSKLDGALCAWVDGNPSGARPVLLDLELVDLGKWLAEGTAYDAASHLIWGGEVLGSAMDRIASCARPVASLSLLRAHGSVWEQGIPYIHDLGSVMVECTAAELRALAEVSVVTRATAADEPLPWPEAPNEDAAGASPLAAPAELCLSKGTTADTLRGAALSHGWKLIGRDDIKTSRDARPLTLPALASLPPGALRIAGWGQPLDAQLTAALPPSLVGASWCRLRDPQLTPQMLAWLLEGFGQLQADVVAMAAVEVGDAVSPLFLFLRTEATVKAPTGIGRPAAPSAVLATKGSHVDVVKLLWEAVGENTIYEVLRRPQHTGAYEPIAMTRDLSYADVKVEIGQQYEYVVRALAERLGAESDVAVGYVGLVPFPVEAVWASQAGTGIRVEWTASPSATFYRLLRSEPISGTGGPMAKQYAIAEVSETWFVDLDVSVGQIYQYRVFAHNGCGRAELSPCAEASILFCAVPTGPEDPPYRVEASRGEPFDRIHVSWSEIPGADRYRVLRSESYVGEYEEVAVVAGRTWQDLDAVRCVDYWYRLQTVYEGGQSAPSASAHGICGYRPAAPQDVHASSGESPNEIRVSWEPVAHAEVYNITRAPSEEGPFAVVASGLSETVFADQGLEPGQEFWYKVRASNLCGCSGDSGAVRGATVDP